MTKKIRLGLIGATVATTWASRSHLPALLASKDFELVAVCTTRAETAEAVRRKVGARLAFHDYREMVASPEIDAVAVVVRVPSHYAPAKAAIEAGKHVYCEWPLGKTTAEGEELAALAKARGVKTAVGLQSRVDPTLGYVKELIESGYVGEILACTVCSMRDGVLERPSSRTWQRDASLAANTFTIGAGHTIDALRFVAGDFARLTALVSTQVNQWYETDTKKTLEVTSPDNVLVSGQLVSGAVASVHVGTIPWAGNEYRMEIYGRAGTLVVTGANTPQFGDLRLQGAQGSNTLADLPVPQRLVLVDPGTPQGDSYNVGQMYCNFAHTIRSGERLHPDFDTAVVLHRFLDSIKLASDTGRQVELKSGD